MQALMHDLYDLSGTLTSVDTEALVLSSFDVLQKSIVITDRRGRVVHMNRLAAGFFGTDQQSYYGAEIETVCDLGCSTHPVRDALSLRERVSFDGMLVIGYTGHATLANVSAMPLFSESGALNGAVLTMRDVTEQLLKEKELVTVNARVGRLNEDMHDSISYAQSIQQAIMPDPAKLAPMFRDAFVLMKPKDIISGDFYHFMERNGRSIVIVADCTGHGVPGALMSMAGCSFINEIVGNLGITSPSLILHELDQRIRQLMQTRSPGYHGADGMDIAVCSIDRKAQIIEFAGAGRPAFFVHDGEPMMVPGNRHGLGGDAGTPLRPYATHTLRYTAGDCFYLFSDGFADQFGGKRGKKLLTKNFTRLLDATSSMPFNMQHRLLGEWHDRWKGELEQTDDLLVVGLGL